MTYLAQISVTLGFSGGSEPVISEREVAVATSREELTGVARQNEPGVRRACVR